MENSDKTTVAPDEITVKELLFKLRKGYRYLLSKWVTILCFGILGSLLGFTYAVLKKPVYTAKTTFVLEDSGASGSVLSQYAGIASMAGIDLGGGGGGIFQGDNILELYKSRKMIKKTLRSEVEFNGKKQLLVDRFIEFNKLRDKWSDDPILKNIQFRPQLNNFTRLQDSVLEAIITDINENFLIVDKPDTKLSIIEVSMKSTDEFFAKAFNEKIVQTVNDFYVQTKTKKSLANVAILQRKADSVRAVMNGAIYTAAYVADATPNLNPTRQIQRTAPVQKSQFSAETNKAILSELVKNLEMSKMSLLKETPLIQVVDEPVYPLFKKHFGKVKGLFIGGFLFCFMASAFLMIRKLFEGM